MIEIETTYLAKFLPQDLEQFPRKEIVDVYIPVKREHPTLRIRKNGERCVITKKQPIKEGDAGSQEEQTIVLDSDEFNFLRNIQGKEVRKIRYAYPCNGRKSEIDVFQDALSGLVLVDVEFENEEERNSFSMPDFCLVDVTQEELMAGGMLAGKRYEDIKDVIEGKYGYIKISN